MKARGKAKRSEPSPLVQTFSARANYLLLTRGDAPRCARRLPLAIIFRAFGASETTVLQRTTMLRRLQKPLFSNGRHASALQKPLFSNGGQCFGASETTVSPTDDNASALQKPLFSNGRQCFGAFRNHCSPTDDNTSALPETTPLQRRIILRRFPNTSDTGSRCICSVVFATSRC